MCLLFPLKMTTQLGLLVAVERLDTAILMRSSSRLARRSQSALIRAAAVHAQVLLDNDDDIDTKSGDVRGHRVVRKPKYTRKVAAVQRGEVVGRHRLPDGSGRPW